MTEGHAQEPTVEAACWHHFRTSGVVKLIKDQYDWEYRGRLIKPVHPGARDPTYLVDHGLTWALAVVSATWRDQTNVASWS